MINPATVVSPGNGPDVLPPALAPASGSSGPLARNRAPDAHCQIAARTDEEAIGLWLAEYADSPHTLRTYRKEALRLMHWAASLRGKPVSGLLREDLLAYEHFLANPALDWMDPEKPRHGRERRLFNGPLSPKSIDHTLGILSGLFGYLVSAGYLVGNPLALRRRKQGRQERQQVIERYLEQDLWHTLLDFIDTLPQQTLRDCQHYERVRWLFRLLYATALRVSEAAHARVSDLVQRRGRWWLKVCGKGNVQGEVPVSDNLMADFARYRQFYGLSALPLAEEETPLLLSVAGRAAPLTPASVYLIVKEVFRRAAEAVAQQDPAGAAKLQRASTHWLRHTAATHQADNGNDLRHIQKNLRHASIETTSLYLHAEDDERHDATTRRKPA